MNLNPIDEDIFDDEENTRPIPIKKLVQQFEKCSNEKEKLTKNGKAVKNSKSSLSSVNSLDSNNTLNETTNIGSLGNLTGMKVYLRVRPLSSQVENTISVLTNTTISTTAPELSKRAQYTKKEERHYEFNRVFGPNSEQTDVFETVATPLLEKFMAGENVLLFAYGMTNAGKTYTIQGDDSNRGILPRIIDYITQKNANSHLTISILEIYQEKIYDLLGMKREKLTIRDGSGRVEVGKLSNHPIHTPQDGVRLLQLAADKRAKSHTALNSGSSRSHAIYSITLVQNINNKEIVSTYQIVDLAGAERSTRTKATATQQKEANTINMSLMLLWRCLQSMKKKSDTNVDIIPFRESKLTHILMPVFCQTGLSGVALVACVNPQIDDYDETISILGNASLACKLKESANIGRTMRSNSQTLTASSSFSSINLEYQRSSTG